METKTEIENTLLKLIKDAEWDINYHNEKLNEAQKKLNALTLSLENLPK